MTRYFSILLFILCIASSKSYAQVDLVFDSVKQLDLNSYASKPVDSFLQVIPQSYNFIHIYGNLSANNEAVGLAIRYPSGMMIYIKPKHFIYMNRIDPNNNWDIQLFKKEIASHIMVLYPGLTGLIGSYP